MSKQLMMAILIVLAVACESATARSSESLRGVPVGELAQGQGDLDLSALAEKIAQLEAQLEELQKPQDIEELAVLGVNIAELESRLDALHWTEADAIRIVQSRLGEHVRACTRVDGGPIPNNCWYDGSQYGKGLSSDYGRTGSRSTGLLRILLERGGWSAFRDSEDFRWRVLLLVQQPDGPISANFHVYEKTGLVEGAARTAEQIIDDLLRELES